jgi:hypothetical protein
MASEAQEPSLVVGYAVLVCDVRFGLDGMCVYAHIDTCLMHGMVEKFGRGG